MRELYCPVCQVALDWDYGDLDWGEAWLCHPEPPCGVRNDVLEAIDGGYREDAIDSERFARELDRQEATRIV